MAETRNLSQRVIVYTRVSDIPGNPQRRHITLGDLLCREVLNQDFHPQLQLNGYDHVHIPADFDTDRPVKRWFVFDLNVVTELAPEDVAQIPHQVFLASRQEGDKWYVRSWCSSWHSHRLYVK